MRTFIIACCLFLSLPAAGQVEDLELIPASVRASRKPEAPAAKNGWLATKFHIEDEGQGYADRSHIPVPVPNQYLPGWMNRATFYGKVEMRPFRTLRLTLVDHLHYLNDNRTYAKWGKPLNDLNEAYASWNAFGTNYLDAGRINLKSGVAIGFNPTDYFKKDAVSVRISEDPLILRENRLGTLMARWQNIHPLGSLTLAAAPKLPTAHGRWITDDTSTALWLQRTNAVQRYLAKASSSYRGLSGDLLYYNENRDSFMGADLAHGWGDQFVMYGEWSGGRQYNIVADALLDDAQSLGIDAEKYVKYVPGDSRKRFRNQISSGFSFTEKEHKRTTFVEYHYNEAGMTPKDWAYWYQAGYYTTYIDIPALAPICQSAQETLWSIRSYAQRSMEPTTRQEVFIRNQWQEAFIKKLDLVHLFQINLIDGSFFAQPQGIYSLNDHIALTLTLYFYAGGTHSEYGSVKRWNTSKFAVRYYFN